MFSQNRLSIKSVFCLSVVLICLGSPLHAAETGAPERIRILYASTATSFTPIWIASELGIYKKHGLDAEAVLLGGGPLIVSTLLAGSADIGVGVGESPIRVALQGSDMKIFALQKSARFLSIVSKPTIHDPAQIKVVGVQSIGGSPHSYWLWYARQKKLPEQQVQFIHSDSSAENFLALKSGRVDAAVFGLPYDVLAEREGFRLLVDGMKNPQPLPATCYFASAGFLAKRPLAARRFIAAMKEAIQIFREDKPTAIKIIEKRLKLKDPVVLERAYRYERHFMRAELSLRLDILAEALTEAKRALGANVRRPDLTVDDVIDRSFVGTAR